jgi:hypothetical protein
MASRPPYSRQRRGAVAWHAAAPLHAEGQRSPGFRRQASPADGTWPVPDNLGHTPGQRDLSCCQR